MTTHKWLVSILAVGFVVLLYNLPKVVVDNDASETSIGTTNEAPTDLHTFEPSVEDNVSIARFRNNIANTSDIKKSAIFADSLANLYLRLNQLDSAVKYGSMILEMSGDVEEAGLASEIFFKAFGFASDGNDAKRYAELAANGFKKVLSERPGNPEIRAKLAMTLVTTSNPMQGINMLRDILREYPDNTTALYSLGVLSMQSGQYDKAVDRFKKLVDLDPANVQAAFYLGVSYYETGDNTAAQEWFEKVKKMDNDPAIQQAVGNYLKEINEL